MIFNKIDNQIKAFKTPCCNDDWYRSGRANFRCAKCDGDITLYIIFYYISLTE